MLVSEMHQIAARLYRSHNPSTEGELPGKSLGALPEAIITSHRATEGESRALPINIQTANGSATLTLWETRVVRQRHANPSFAGVVHWSSRYLDHGHHPWNDLYAGLLS